MTTEITIKLNKAYFVQVDNYVGVQISSFAKLVDFLSSFEFNTLVIEFNTCGIEKYNAKEKANYIKRVNKLAGTLNMEVSFIENTIIDGYEFPNNYVGALV